MRITLIALALLPLLSVGCASQERSGDVPRVREFTFTDLDGMQRERDSPISYALDLETVFETDSIAQIIFNVDTSDLNRGRQLCEQENQTEWCPDRLAIEDVHDDDAVREIDRWELLTSGDGSTARNRIDLNEQRFYEPDGRNKDKFPAVAAAIADGRVRINVIPSTRDVHTTWSIVVVVRTVE